VDDAVPLAREQRAELEEVALRAAAQAVVVVDAEDRGTRRGAGVPCPTSAPVSAARAGRDQRALRVGPRGARGSARARTATQVRSASAAAVGVSLASAGGGRSSTTAS
jgi:hypothetical protein